MGARDLRRTGTRGLERGADWVALHVNRFGRLSAGNGAVHAAHRISGRGRRPAVLDPGVGRLASSNQCSRALYSDPGPAASRGRPARPCLGSAPRFGALAFVALYLKGTFMTQIETARKGLI